MSKQQTQFVILCEDTQQEVCVRHFLLERGVHRRKIRVRKNPKGRGAGEQFVRELYSLEVREYRRRSTYQTVALVAVMDADTRTVANSMSWLDQMLVDDFQQQRSADERIALLVPKRNIETWIQYFKTDVADENEIYPGLNRAGDCKIDVQRFAKTDCFNNLPATAPPSLHSACDELWKILA
ncbi:MAG TPA: hypothetical protein G4N96_11545 [Chloroflexi bacterium]|nr:hypothetical protein [Chloroflexota bacterium]